MLETEALQARKRAQMKSTTGVLGLLWVTVVVVCVSPGVQGELVARWTFDGSLDAPMASVPPGHPASLANVSGQIQQLTERARTFLRLPGTETRDCVTLGEGAPFDLTRQFSLEAWFRPHPSPAGSYTMVLGKRYSHQYQLSWTPNGRGTVEFYVGGGHLTQNRAYASPIKPGNWLHIVAVYDGPRDDGPNQWLYVNGKLSNATRNPLALKPSSGPLRIAQNSTMDMKNSVRADWDEAAVFDHALSPAEIATLYEAKAERARRPAEAVWSPELGVKQWQLRTGAAGASATVDRMSGIKQTEGISKATAGTVVSAADGTRFSLKGNPPERLTGSWRSSFPEAVDLTGLPYCFVRCRARGIQRAMTPVPVLSLTGNAGRVLLTSSHTIQDGLWHVCVVKTGDVRWATGLEVALATRGGEAELELAEVRFAATLDALPAPTGLVTDPPRAERAGEFKTVDLSGQLNGALSARTERLLSKDGAVLRNPLTAFQAPFVSWRGVPFSVGARGADLVIPEARNAAVNQEQVDVLGVSVAKASFMPESRDDTLTVPVDAKVAEVFMLLSCGFPAIRKRYSRPPVPVVFTDIEAFSVDLHYDDGSVDQAFPYSVEHHGYRVCGLVGAYVVPADPAKRLQKVVLHNRTWRHTVSLIALTLRTSSDRLFPALASEPPAPASRPIDPLSPGPPTVTLEGRTVRLANACGDLVLDCSTGFRIAHIRPRWETAPVTFSPDSGLEVEHDGTVLNGTDFECTGLSVKGTTARISLHCPRSELPLELMLTISACDNAEWTFQIEVLNTGEKALAPVVRCPMIRQAVLGASEDTWIFFPQYRNVMTNRRAFCKQPNHRGFPMQFMDIYNPVAGVGVCLMTRSLSGEPVEYCLSKDDTGASAYVESGGKDYPVSPAHATTYCPRVVVLHPGDWHGAAEAYGRWTESWYVPVGSQDKAWFREAVWLRSHLSSPTSAKRIAHLPPIVDPETKRYRISEFLEQDRRLFGLDPDIVHFYVWAFDRAGKGDASRSGEYGGPDYDNLGGVANFAAAIREIQRERGMPASLYTIWDRCSRSTPFVKKHGERFAKVRHTGQTLVNSDTVYMATSTPVWRKHAAETLSRLQSDTKAQILYLDVFGSDHRSRCFNPNAGHAMPSRVSQGDRDFLRAVRQAQPYGVAIWGEFPTTDIASVFWDGFISYDCIPLHSYLAEDYEVSDRAPLWSSLTLPPNVLRFLFPKLKQAVFPVGQEGHIESWRFMKFLLFNGQALFDTTWRLYETDCRMKLGKSLQIMRTHADCFASDHPRMFVPTLRGHLHANEWPGTKRTVWTLFNGRYQMLRGDVLRVPHTPGATYRDLWNDRELTPEVQGDCAILNLSLPPQGIGCIVRE